MATQWLVRNIETGKMYTVVEPESRARTFDGRLRKVIDKFACKYDRLIDKYQEWAFKIRGEGDWVEIKLK